MGVCVWKGGGGGGGGGGISGIKNILTKLAQDGTGRIVSLSHFCMVLAALDPYWQDLGPIFSQYGSRAQLIRYITVLICTCSIINREITQSDLQKFR